MFYENVDSQGETQRLAVQYGFTAEYVFTSLSGFIAQLDSGIVAQLRCEATVRYIEFDGIASPGASELRRGALPNQRMQLAGIHK